MAEWGDVEDTISGASQLAGERRPPISDAVFARLLPILQAGNLEPWRGAAEQLDYIARSSLQTVAHRDRPPRERPAPRKYRRRPGDPPRERLIRARGAPRNREMRQLFGSLEGFWLDQTGAAPGKSYSDERKEYGGPFVRFAVAFCAELSIAMNRLKDFGPLPEVQTAFLGALIDVASNPVRVKTWLEAIRVTKPKPRIRCI